MAKNENYVEYIYDFVKHECEGMDAIYADYIEYLVGAYGLKALIESKLLESCGVVNNRQLYVLCNLEAKA